MEEFKEALNELCAQHTYDITSQQVDKMCAYYDCLVKTNQQYNITAITLPKEAALKHFFDSVVPCGSIAHGARVIDIGSGGGFPIAPIKIMREDVRAYANEASKKKCDFIVVAAKEADIEINIVNARAEDAARGELRDSFDVCMSRAVAVLPVLMELCAPFAKTGGLFFAYKGEYKAELEQAKTAAKTMGLSLVDIIKMPITDYSHHVLVFEKKKQTPEEYPRNYAQIAKRPL